MKHNAEQPQPAQQPGAVDPPAPAPEGALVELPEEAVARLEGEFAELKDKYLRLAAEYDNFRKRTAKERAEVWARAQTDVVQRLVDALDDLARFAHVDRAQVDAQTIHDGVELVERKLWKELEALGVTRVDQVGVPFDPNLHEAVTTQPAERAEIGEIEIDGPPRTLGRPRCSRIGAIAPQLVILPPLVGVAQDVVRLVDLLEALGRLGFGVSIGMVLLGEPAERLLDLVHRRGLGDAKDLIIVLRGGHQPPSPRGRDAAPPSSGRSPCHVSTTTRAGRINAPPSW